MQILKSDDGREFHVCEIIKASSVTNDTILKSIRNNRRYDATIKHADKFLLCNEIYEAVYEMIIPEPSPKISSVKITSENLENTYSNSSDIGSTVNVKI